MTDATIIKAQVLRFTASPFEVPPEAAARVDEAVLIRDGIIVETGPLRTLQATAPEAQLQDHSDALLCAGFVDAHVHYPQTAIIASWGKRLIDWLQDYTFPEETRFQDPDYATEIANRYLDLALSHGTTTMSSYCTSHPESVTAFFEAAQARGLRAIAGKTCMDRNAPVGLRDTAKTAHDDSAALIARWHGQDRLGYAITPRFSPTSSEAQLEALGALWAENPSCLMQTHLSEQSEEITWVKSLFPEARDYLDTYELHGLLGPRGLYGHAIHLTPREKDRLAETGAALAHCPTSNLFIGSGVFDLNGCQRAGLRLGLATDTGGGSSFSMLRTMAATYEVAQLNGHSLHPAQLLWLATVGSADALYLGGRIGTVAPGYEADLVALDLASTPAIAQRSARADDLWEAVFPTIMMGDERAIQEVWISGQSWPR